MYQILHQICTKNRTTCETEKQCINVGVFIHICSGCVLCDKQFCDPLNSRCLFRLSIFVLLLALTVCKGC